MLFFSERSSGRQRMVIAMPLQAAFGAIALSLLAGLGSTSVSTWGQFDEYADTKAAGMAELWFQSVSDFVAAW
jgi:hypothetical protein